MAKIVKLIKLSLSHTPHLSRILGPPFKILIKTRDAYICFIHPNSLSLSVTVFFQKITRIFI